MAILNFTPSLTFPVTIDSARRTRVRGSVIKMQKSLITTDPPASHGFSLCTCGRKHFLGEATTPFLPISPSYAAPSTAPSTATNSTEVLNQLRPPKPDWYFELYGYFRSAGMERYEKEIAVYKKKLFANLVGKAETVLEIGIGAGPNIKYYNNIPNVSVLGVDPNPKMESHRFCTHSRLICSLKMIEFAGLCIGVGILIEVYNRTDPKRKAENLASITQIDELKGLVDLLEKEPLSNPVVAIFGTVGSNSAVETTRSGTLCVFSEETATVCYKRDKNKNCNTYSNREESKEVMLYRKVVPWYLDDGTCRVYVTGAQFAKGFYATLNGYIFPEPVMEHFERFFSSKDVQFVPNRCREHVLEIGKPLTIIGKAERDKNGAPTIGRVYQVFNGRSINKIDELASDFNSVSDGCEMLSLLLAGIGVSIIAVSLLTA